LDFELKAVTLWDWSSPLGRRWKFIKARRMTYSFLNLATRWMIMLFTEVGNRRKRKCGRRMIFPVSPGGKL